MRKTVEMPEPVQGVINRIRQMEQYMDEILKARENGTYEKEPALKEKLSQLAEYQESGQWLFDYIYDERGELPADLKRGVLSQDILYELLCELKTGG